MDLAQIQIIPVEDGAFFIQVINADGSGQKNPRHVAQDREKLVEKVKLIADSLFTKEPPAPPPTVAGTPQTGIVGQTHTPVVPTDGTPRT